MTFKKSLYLLFLITIVPIYANGQQLPQLTQYMMNNYAINPAVAGMQDYYQIRTTIRNQWVGIEDAPTTNILSVYGKRGNNVGLGGIVFNDQVGLVKSLHHLHFDSLNHLEKHIQKTKYKLRSTLQLRNHLLQ